MKASTAAQMVSELIEQHKAEKSEKSSIKDKVEQALDAFVRTFSDAMTCRTQLLQVHEALIFEAAKAAKANKELRTALIDVASLVLDRHDTVSGEAWWSTRQLRRTTALVDALWLRNQLNTNT